MSERPHAAVEIRGLAKRFGRGSHQTEALKPFDADLLAGELTGLVGPDGAGKTTLMRLMAALMRPSEGTIRVAGASGAERDGAARDSAWDTVRDAERIHSLAGYMPQRFGLYEDLSVAENLRLYAKLRSLRGPRKDEVMERLLHFTRLEPFTGRLAGRLSGGMKQKLGLACALMARPRVLLLDEPSVGVDPLSRRELWSMVRELTDDGMAVVWSTAYLDEAERCDRVLLLDRGELKHAGPPGELTARLAGRSLRISGLDGKDRRQFLAEALDSPAVRDGVIQGAGLRLVLSEPSEAAPAPRRSVETLASEGHVVVDDVEPRFEDAFIDLLGGGPGGRSAIAEALGPVEFTTATPVSCRGLTKRFGDFTATDDVSFDVRPGEIFGLLGPNGAGKSTTFKMLCGLLRPTAGEARVAGYDLRKAGSDAKRHLGYMAQKFSLYGILSVEQNLDFFSGVYGLSGRERRERKQQMVDTFDLGPFLHESPGDLPLGFKQRLALACALMHQPPVLFLDEPTSGVDPITRREFWTHINGLVANGVTVMVTTHFMDEAEYCDRVGLIHQGRLIALDSPDALKQDAASDDRPDPTMEEAFIALIERRIDDQSQREAA